MTGGKCSWITVIVISGVHERWAYPAPPVALAMNVAITSAKCNDSTKTDEKIVYGLLIWERNKFKKYLSSIKKINIVQNSLNHI